MNAMDVGINKALFIREIMPVDELLDAALHFKTERDLRLYNTLKNDMDYYGIKRDEFVKSQNFSIADEYLTKYKRAITIIHRQLQTLSPKAAKPTPPQKRGLLCTSIHGFSGDGILNVK
jgi:hypothetical protein